MDISDMDNPNWFLTKKFSENIYLTTEHHFAIGNRANCWLIRVSVVVPIELFDEVC